MFSSRMDGIELSGIRKMFDIATDDSVNLGLGEPDFQPPNEAIEAVYKAMKEGKNKYGPTNGIPILREALAERMRTYWKGVGSGNVVVTNSGSEALFSSAMTFIDRGDEVLMPDPGFVLYEPHIKLTGGIPKMYSLDIDRDFAPDPDEISGMISDRTKMMIVNSPNNPTGGMLTRQDRDDLIDIIREHDLIVVSDEVYDSMIYSGSRHHSFLGAYEKSVVINSFSKLFAMTGWRLGYMTARDDLIGKLSLAHYHMVACPPTPIQYGALEALKNSQVYVDRMVTQFQRRRDRITDRLNEMEGFRTISPKGTFYSFPRFDLNHRGGKLKSNDLAMELAKSGLICSPGTAFGERGEYHLRFSFVNSLEQIDRGMDILEEVSSNYRD